MTHPRRGVAVLVALGAAVVTVAPASAASLPPPPPVPATVTHPARAAAAPAPAAATPMPVPLHAPGDPSAAGRRLLRAINAVDEGFLLGLPGAGPKGPTAYVPPEPRRDAGDAAVVLFAGLAGLLAAVGGGAAALAVLLRPRPAAGTPPVRASVALPPQTAGTQPRRTVRLSRDAFDRLPPLLQLALLDRTGQAPEVD